METPTSPTAEVTETNEITSRKAGRLPSLKDIQRSWRTHIGFEFCAEGNNLVDHLGI